MVQTSLNPEEIEYIVDEARYGELDSLKQIFTEIDDSLLVTQLVDLQSESTLVHMASANGHFEVVQLLLSILSKLHSKDSDESKKFINKQNKSGNTALHWAALNGHLEIVRVLCDEFEADPFVKNSAGHDAIFEAENSGKTEVEDYFLKKFSFDPEDGDDGEAEGDENKEGGAETSKPTFKPGKEIEEVTKEAYAAQEALQQQKQQQQQQQNKEDAELVNKTGGLKI